MKKIMIAALMILSTSAAFAGDSDVLKTILKAKTYAEAEQLVKSSLGQLANDEEKAKAYNKLVDLALDKVNAEQAVQIENQTNQQMGKEGNKPVDENGLYQAVSNAMAAAFECNKYDQLPNVKGKVKPKFADANANRLYFLRGQLISGGIFYQNNKDDANAYKFLAEYVDTYDNPLFAGVKKADENLGNIAYYAAYYAFQNKDFVRAEKYIAYSITDKEKAADAKTLQLQILQAQLKNHEDSVAYVNKLEGMYAADTNNEAVFGNLANMYSLMGQTAKAETMIDARLSAEPDNYLALAMKGDITFQKKEYDKAIEPFVKALSLAKDDNTRIRINSIIGQCYFYKAQDKVGEYKGVLTPVVKQQFDAVYNKAIEYFKTAKDLDVMKEFKANWAYALYLCYYFVNGADDPVTQSAAADAGVQ